ncbi:nucleotide exchange factor GrpE [Streptomyces bacillaris]|uniref:hypothetical protein n=1 Tax=Streptomyces bacillaris TaxID=68179 RepID=UPI00365EC3F6
MTFAHRAAQFSMLRHLAEKHGDLPDGYVTSHTSDQVVQLLLNSMSDFETWRDALGVPASGVAIDSFDSRHELSIDLPLGDSVVRIWAVTEPTSTRGTA